MRQMSNSLSLLFIELFLDVLYFQGISLYFTLLFSKMSGTDDFSVSNGFLFLKICQLCYFVLLRHFCEKRGSSQLIALALQ